MAEKLQQQKKRSNISVVCSYSDNWHVSSACKRRLTMFLEDKCFPSPG